MPTISKTPLLTKTKLKLSSYPTTVPGHCTHRGRSDEPGFRIRLKQCPFDRTGPAEDKPKRLYSQITRVNNKVPSVAFPPINYDGKGYSQTRRNLAHFSQQQNHKPTLLTNKQQSESLKQSAIKTLLPHGQRKTAAAGQRSFVIPKNQIIGPDGQQVSLIGVTKHVSVSTHSTPIKNLNKTAQLYAGDLVKTPNRFIKPKQSTSLNRVGLSAHRANSFGTQNQAGVEDVKSSMLLMSPFDQRSQPKLISGARSRIVSVQGHHAAQKQKSMFAPGAVQAQQRKLQRDIIYGNDQQHNPKHMSEQKTRRMSTRDLIEAENSFFRISVPNNPVSAFPTNI